MRVACTVSVTVTSAPHPPEPAASASPMGAEPPDPPVAAPVAVAGTTVMVSVVVEEIVVVVVGSLELATWALTPATPDAAGVGAQIVYLENVSKVLRPRSLVKRATKQTYLSFEEGVGNHYGRGNNGSG